MARGVMPGRKPGRLAINSRGPLPPTPPGGGLYPLGVLTIGALSGIVSLAEEDLLHECKGEEMTIERNYTGAWIISDIVGNEYIKRVYMGYTKRDAMRLFRADVKRRKNVRGFADAMQAYRIANGGF